MLVWALRLLIWQACTRKDVFGASDDLRLLERHGLARRVGPASTFKLLHRRSLSHLLNLTLRHHRSLNFGPLTLNDAHVGVTVRLVDQIASRPIVAGLEGRVIAIGLGLGQTAVFRAVVLQHRL